MEEWFNLVNRKNMMVRQESDLVYELRDLELIEQHDQLEKEIRKRVAKDGKIFNVIIIVTSTGGRQWPDVKIV